MPTVTAVRNAELEKQVAELQEQIASASASPKAFEPAPNTPLWASLLVGILGAASPAALSLIPPPWGPLVAIILGGVSLGVATHFGIKSSGTAQKTPSK